MPFNSSDARSERLMTDMNLLNSNKHGNNFENNEADEVELRYLRNSLVYNSL
jgi:hypothetical protein